MSLGACADDSLACDYLVTSANVEDLAFVDRLLAENQVWTVIIVDTNAHPGGRWCHAPPFAKLDQPSAFYGVGSMPMDASKTMRRDEILQYCQRIVEHFVQRGRVQYFPMTTFDGKNLCSIIDSDIVKPVVIRRKVVRSSFSAPVQAARMFPFHVAAGTLVVPPKELPLVASGHAKYVVIGSGRSGMEAVVWLLKQGVCPEKLHWVVPEDMWLVSQSSMEPENYVATARKFWALFVESDTVEEFELGLEREGLRHRVDPTKRPTLFRGTTVTDAELVQLRRVIPNIIRKGLVREVHTDRVVLEHGDVATGPDTLHIDCMAGYSVGGQDTSPIWQSRRITLQLVREIADNGPVASCFSAALIGHAECVMPHETTAKNAMCTPMLPPRTVVDGLRNELASMRAAGLRSHPSLGTFLMVGRPGRLSAMEHKSLRQLLGDRADEAERLRVMANLERLAGEAPKSPPLRASTGGLSRKTSEDQSVAASESSTCAPSAHFDFDELERLEQLAQAC